MIVWEYKVLVIVPGEKVSEKLNEAGAEGWEVVYLGQAIQQTLAGPEMTWQVVFKRPKV